MTKVRLIFLGNDSLNLMSLIDITLLKVLNVSNRGNQKTTKAELLY